MLGVILASWVLTGCNLVFPLRGSDAAEDAAVLDANAPVSCTAPNSGWGNVSNDLLGAEFSSTQEMSRPTIIDEPGVGGEVMLFDFDDTAAEPRRIRWAKFVSGNFVGQGNLSLATVFTSYDHPRLFANEDNQPRLLFSGETNDGSLGVFEASPGAVFGRDWTATQVSLPPELETMVVQLGTPGAHGTRVVAEADGLLIELERTSAGRYALLEDTLDLVNQAGGGSSPQLADDGCWVVFSRFERGNLGDQDLYIATRQPDGTFGTPVLLPSMSAVDERDPFITPDLTRLYFVSESGNKLRPKFMTRSL